MYIIKIIAIYSTYQFGQLLESAWPLAECPKRVVISTCTFGALSTATTLTSTGTKLYGSRHCAQDSLKRVRILYLGVCAAAIALFEAQSG